MEFKKYYKEPTEPYDIMSVSVFRMKRSYKSTKLYYDGLKSIVDEIQDLFPNFYLRIYFDRSIVKTTHKSE